MAIGKITFLVWINFIWVGEFVFADNLDAGGVVEKLQAELIAVMKQADSLGYQGRFKRLSPAIIESHDLDTIARVAVGSHWRKLSDAQKRQFLELFTTLSIATYAYRFDGHEGEVFKILFATDVGRKDKLVKTVLIEQKGNETQIDYRLRLSENGQWKIINVIAEGVSDLALKRSEYTSILRREGFGALKNKLTQKIANYADHPG